MRVPSSASPDIQQAFRDVWTAVDRFAGPGNIDLSGRRIINAGASIGTSGYVTKAELDAAATSVANGITTNTTTTNNQTVFDEPVFFTLFQEGSIPFIGPAKEFSEDRGNLVWDRTNHRMGLGIGSPSARLHASSTASPVAILDGYTVSPTILGRRANGTTSVPTAALLDQDLAVFAGAGYGTAFTTERAHLAFRAAENWTVANQGTYLDITTTPKLSTTPASRMQILDDGRAKFLYQVNLAAGLVSSPALSFTASVTTGWYSSTPGDWVMAIGSAATHRLTATGLTLGASVVLGWTGTDALAAADAALSRNGAAVNVSAGDLQVAATKFVVTASTGAIATLATAALTTPAESWVGPSSTAGMYFKGSDYGLGTTDLEAWNASYVGMQLGSHAYLMFGASSQYVEIGQNAYFDGAWKYRAVGYATSFYQSGGSTAIRVAPTAGSAADGAITWTETMRFVATGDVGMAATKKFHLDGVTTAGDTYLVESSADVLDLYAGGANTLRLTATAATVTGTLTATGGFGCNTKTAQAAYASGGALAAYGTGAFGFDSDANASALHALVVSIRAALVANGVMS